MTHKGTTTFVAQRASAAILLPLLGWFLWGVVSHAGAPLDEIQAWVALPINAAFLGVLIVVGSFHMRIGLNEIIDDYIDSGTRGVFKLLNLFASFGAAALGLWSLYVLAV